MASSITVSSLSTVFQNIPRDVFALWILDALFVSSYLWMNLKAKREIYFPKFPRSLSERKPWEAMLRMRKDCSVYSDGQTSILLWQKPGLLRWHLSLFGVSVHKLSSLLRMIDSLHRKKRFTSFPSPAGMSLTKLPLGRNNSVTTSLFPPRESLVVTSRLGTGNSRTFFTV